MFCCTQTLGQGPVLSIARKVFAYNKTDPVVLSIDHSQHIRKVKQGGYIYIADMTSVVAETSKDCELISGKASDLFLMYYSIVLRNNSAYASTMNKM